MASPFNNPYYHRSRPPKHPPTFALLPEEVTLLEASMYLRLGYAALRARLLNGDIPYRRLGRAIRIRKEDLRGGTR